MKKSMLKASLLVGLSTLFAACGSGHHTPSAHNMPSPPTAQPDTQSNSQQSIPRKEQENSSTAEHTEKHSQPKPRENQTQQPSDSMTDQPQADQPQENDNMTPRTESKLSEETLKSQWITLICNEKNNCQSDLKTLEQVTSGIQENQSGSTTNKQPMILSLQLGENKDEQGRYQLTLLGQNNTGSVYYGYFDNSKTNTPKVTGIFHGRREDLTHASIPTNFSATYEGKKGFIYSLIYYPSNQNRSYDPRYGDISLTYNNGQTTGKITKTDDPNTTLFNINEGNTKEIVVTPTNQVTDIPQDDKATFHVHFVDSEKNKNDYKYIVGSGSSDTWQGIFAAERKDNASTTPASSSQ